MGRYLTQCISYRLHADINLFNNGYPVAQRILQILYAQPTQAMAYGPRVARSNLWVALSMILPEMQSKTGGKKFQTEISTA